MGSLSASSVRAVLAAGWWFAKGKTHVSIAPSQSRGGVERRSFRKAVPRKRKRAGKLLVIRPPVLMPASPGCVTTYPPAPLARRIPARSSLSTPEISSSVSARDRSSRRLRRRCRSCGRGPRSRCRERIHSGQPGRRWRSRGRSSSRSCLRQA